MPTSEALWITSPGNCELDATGFETPAGFVEVETLFSGISRGAEALVFRGEVPETEWQRMRCPLQEGVFAFPVKYGYATVGVVEEGPHELLDRTVFVLHPHQARFSAPESMAVPLPKEVPAARAVLAASMETALNIVWDARAAPGDRIAIVGAGVIGALAGYLCARIPGTEVTLVDKNPMRAALASTLGCRFALPQDSPEDCDVVIHASASTAGLATALAAAAMEARVVEASWYGANHVSAPLGAAFHSRRLQLVSSQVGHVPADRRVRWPNRRRLKTALGLLADAGLDILISGESEFSRLPARYAAILADPATLCHRVRYGRTQ
ncbi:zinc-dependent alcohol dehydrogenase [Arvimicrobium flavum]|uniref:zinc-dependent alcohol dehydrogenase n=1 Tax=Arvimicrobium flavum TaxID=3393320 RepID=UPI00237B3804|nr:zinc-binding alcohol dehydrogenase [Mesorhizobium shangrilense]